MTDRFLSLPAASLIAAAVLLPVTAEAQGRRGPRVAVRSTVVVGAPYYYYPYWYDAWYPYGYWGPAPFYAGRYADNSASLRLQVTPRNAEVFVDGYYAGVVDDFDGTFQRLTLEPGEHELQLFLPGYRAVVQRVYLQPRSPFRVRHTLEPLRPGDPEPVRPAGAPPAPGTAPGPRAQAPRPVGPGPGTPRPAPGNREYGTVAVRVQPADAEVLIDGERWDGAAGDERLTVQLAPGPHRIEVRKDGYRAFTTDVDVRPGETTPLNIALARTR